MSSALQLPYNAKLLTTHNIGCGRHNHHTTQYSTHSLVQEIINIITIIDTSVICVWNGYQTKLVVTLLNSLCTNTKHNELQGVHSIPVVAQQPAHSL
jgi:hypothetical protein